MQVFVLLFNARTENEGIHTLKKGDRNIVLMFEEQDDATRYALLLEAQDFYNPTVEAIDEDDVRDFCDSADYDCQLIKAGQLEVPPESNLESIDWSPEDKNSPAERSNDDSPSALSSAELEQIRKRLEGLL